MHQTDDDVDLARDLLSGKEEAFDRFLERFRTKIFQYSYLMCGQREDAEEVSQETLLKVFEKLDQLKEPENIRAWVFRIAKNACLMKRRKRTHEPRTLVSVEQGDPARGEGAAPIDVEDPSMRPDQLALNAWVGERLRAALLALPPPLRTIVVLREIEGLSTREVATIAGISEDNVKTRLHRARMLLRERLEGV